jgi:hypothetical protein
VADGNRDDDEPTRERLTTDRTQKPPQVAK